MEALSKVLAMQPVWSSASDAKSRLAKVVHVRTDPMFSSFFFFFYYFCCLMLFFPYFCSMLFPYLLYWFKPPSMDSWQTTYPQDTKPMTSWWPSWLSPDISLHLSGTTSWTPRSPSAAWRCYPVYSWHLKDQRPIVSCFVALRDVEKKKHPEFYVFFLEFNKCPMGWEVLYFGGHQLK